MLDPVMFSIGELYQPGAIRSSYEPALGHPHPRREPSLRMERLERIPRRDDPFSPHLCLRNGLESAGRWLDPVVHAALREQDKARGRLCYVAHSGWRGTVFHRVLSPGPATGAWHRRQLHAYCERLDDTRRHTSTIDQVRGPALATFIPWGFVVRDWQGRTA